MILYQTGDFAFTRPKNGGFFSSAIGWVTRRRDESKTLATHTMPFLHENLVIDAQVYGIQTNHFGRKYVAPGNHEYCVYRMKGLDDRHRAALRNKIGHWEVRGYSLIKIGLQLIDGLISKAKGHDVWFARRLGNFSSRYVICSWCTGAAGSFISAWPSRWAKMSNPDELLDYILAPENADRFELITSSPDFFPSPA